MTRTDARIAAMQILYEMDASGSMTVEKAKMLCDERLAGNHKERIADLMEKIISDLDSIDENINRCSTGWKTRRMPKVDLAIMRLACGEMRFDDDIPDAVAVNEAIDIARKYSTDQSARFIHGVLGAISKNE